MLSEKKLAPLIDHTLLKPTGTEQDLQQLCAEAVRHGFATVCIHPHFVSLAKKLTANSAVKVCTVVGFPLGVNLSQTKISETQHVIQEGADEVDVVINMAALKDQQWTFVQEDLSSVVSAAQGKTVKVIIETCLLSHQETVRASQVCEAAGAHFVKTSSGFSSGGATLEDIRLIRQSVSSKMGIKASGGIRNRAFALELVAAGASRLGASASIELIQGE